MIQFWVNIVHLCITNHEHCTALFLTIIWSTKRQLLKCRNLQLILKIDAQLLTKLIVNKYRMHMD